MTHTPTSPQPDATDDLDQLFYRELRGKTVTPEQQRTLEWAQRRLIPALKARDTRREAEARIDELQMAIAMSGRALVAGVLLQAKQLGTEDSSKVDVEVLKTRLTALKEKTKDE